jgi:glycosyltransferase involved in cell wall biosynthesis
VTFTGVMSYPPNVEAATWFARRVWPLVRAAVPGARYRVVGRKPTPAVLALAAEPGVEVVGAVPDMQAELRKAWVAVAPMRDGGGIKNKVLEAWAVGTPVVMTHLAANGLSLDAAAAALVTSVPAVFADRVVALLREPSRRDVLSRAAHELAGREHGWEHAAEQLSRLLRAGAGLPGARREEAGLVVA